jgi:putative transposase
MKHGNTVATSTNTLIVGHETNSMGWRGAAAVQLPRRTDAGPTGRLGPRVQLRPGGVQRDFHHKLSTTIVRDNQAVYVEDLAVVGLARTRLAKSVHDAGWAQFTTMLQYKAARHGRVFGRVDRWFPSTRLCSVCGVIGEKLPLNVRSWTCCCGTVHDRHINAARNVLAAGRADNSNDRGAHVRPTPVSAARRETVIHPDAARSTRSVEGIPAL